MKNSLILIILFVCILTSCDYQPKGTNPVKVEKHSNPPTVTVELNFDTDTVYINQPTNIQFKFNSDRNIKWIKVYVDSFLFYNDTYGNGSFNVYPSDYPFYNGTHILSLDCFTNSGTGSLADRAGYEGYLFTKKVVLIIDPTMDMRPLITNVSIDQGSLKLEWTKYKGTDFGYYYISRKLTYDYPQYEKIAQIFDQNINFAYDPCYVGEEADYTVTVVKKSTYENLCGNTYHKNKDSPKISVNKSIYGNVDIKWNKTQYYDNFGSYDIYIDNILQISKSNINDTSYTLNNIKFGSNTLVEYRVKPKLLPNDYYSWESVGNYSIYTNISLGDYIGVYEYFATPSGSILYLVKRVDYYYYIFRYNTSTNTIIDSVQIYDYINSFSVSPNENYIAYTYNDIYFTTKSNYPNFTKLNKNKNYYCASTTNNGIGLLRNSVSIKIYNYLSNTPICNRDFPVVYTSSISNDGKYCSVVHNDLELFSIESDSLKNIWTLSNTYSDGFGQFSKKDSNIFIYQDNYNLRFMNVQSLSEVKSYNFQYRVLYIDYDAGQILAATNDYLKVFKLDDGSILYDNIPYSNDSSLGLYFIKNNCIYSSIGYVLKLNKK